MRGDEEALHRHRRIPLRERAQSLWNSYIDWGLAHPLANKAVNQLAVSSSLTPETLAKAQAMFPEAVAETELSGNQVFAGQTDFADAVFLALADTTMAFAARHPRKAKAYKASGFEAMWKMFNDD
ncbi:hypothetical protein ACFS3C_12595 [Azotobacter vinelandii]